MAVDESKSIANASSTFSERERKNLRFFYIGIMFFKFAFELIGVSIALFVLNRISNAAGALTNLVILYGIFQSIGSAISGALLHRYRVHMVMGLTLILFALLLLWYLLMEICTGGSIYVEGKWNPLIIFGIYSSFGLCVGSLECSRRILNPAIVGNKDPVKLKSSDAQVHIFYEVAGTCGAFASSWILAKFGPVFSTAPSLIFFLISAFFYFQLSLPNDFSSDVEMSIVDQSPPQTYPLTSDTQALANQANTCQNNTKTNNINNDSRSNNNNMLTSSVSQSASDCSIASCSSSSSSSSSSLSIVSSSSLSLSSSTITSSSTCTQLQNPTLIKTEHDPDHDYERSEKELGTKTCIYKQQSGIEISGGLSCSQSAAQGREGPQQSQPTLTEQAHGSHDNSSVSLSFLHEHEHEHEHGQDNSLDSTTTQNAITSESRDADGIEKTRTLSKSISCLTSVDDSKPAPATIVNNSTLINNNDTLSIIEKEFHDHHRSEEEEKDQPQPLNIWQSLKLGAITVMGSRDMIWLIPGYVLPQVHHRLLENVVFPVYAKKVLGDGSLTGFMVASSNFGELLGAFCVLKFADRVRTPFPWVRTDAFCLLFCWSLALLGHPDEKWLTLGLLAPILVLVSFGWAGGDVSICAYIQARNNEGETQTRTQQRLSASMSFLYLVYILSITFVGNALAMLIDRFEQPRDALFWVCGVMFSSIAVITFASSFIPRRDTNEC